MIPPTTAGAVADTRRRVLDLEQRPVPRPDGERFTLTACSATSQLDDLDTSSAGPYSPWWGAITLTKMIVHGANVPSVVTLTVLRNGVTLLADEFPNGTAQRGMNERFAPLETLELTAAGRFGQLVVELMFSGPGGGGLVFHNRASFGCG